MGREKFMEYIILCVLGICVFFLGIFTYQGNISFIHWYNRWKVKEEDTKKYAKIMGIGTIIMGISITITSVLQAIFDIESLWYLLLFGIVIGLIFMIYGMLKYNKGIF